jgi:hypothetical protein
MSAKQTSRRGTVLIIVAGISALLAGMALTFLVRMRSDVEESLATVREAQAHIMKVAACNFIMESARLGWDPKPPNESPDGMRTTIRKEAFGWIDVRTGQPGPRGEDGNRLGPVDNNANPIIGPDGLPKWDPWVDLTLPDTQRPAKRCPMYVMVRPPFAVSPRVAVNPITTEGADAFKPYLTQPDPQPFQTGMSSVNFATAYAKGNRQPDLARFVPSWFRVWRATPATFVVTCGIGETQAFRTWQEVRDAGQTDLFGGDNAQGQSMFYFHQTQEIRLWYLIEWSAHVASSDYQNLQNEFSPKTIETYLQRPINTSQESRSQGKLVNPVGTIRFIQRLVNEPRFW